MEELCKAVVTAGGGVAAVVLTPAVVAALGFSATGTVAGSIAANLMALLSGGWPGLIAFLQSFGAVGFSWSGFTLTFATGGVLGNMISSICNQTGTP